MADLGKFLILFGIIAVVVGVVFLISPNIPWLGRLPGDILIRKKTFTIYFPITTSIIISVLLTLLINLFRR